MDGKSSENPKFNYLEIPGKYCLKSWEIDTMDGFMAGSSPNGDDMMKSPDFPMFVEYRTQM